MRNGTETRPDAVPGVSLPVVSPEDEDEDERLRIDELAQASGTTSRNIRAYQARGLLPPPVLQGRTGFYGRPHLQRLRLIAELQERGFSLAAIQQTVETLTAGGDLSQLLGLEHVVSAPWTDETPTPITLERLQELFPEVREDPEGVVEAAVAQGVLHRTPDGLEVPSPLLLDAGAELARVGVPLSAVLDLVAALRVDMADVADRFIELASRHLLDEISSGSATSERMADITSALTRLRPIAMEVVRPFLAQEMARAVGEALEHYAQTMPRGDAGPARSA